MTDHTHLHVRQHGLQARQERGGECGWGPRRRRHQRLVQRGRALYVAASRQDADVSTISSCTSYAVLAACSSHRHGDGGRLLLLLLEEELLLQLVGLVL